MPANKPMSTNRKIKIDSILAKLSITGFGLLAVFAILGLIGQEDFQNLHAAIGGTSMALLAYFLLRKI